MRRGSVEYLFVALDLLLKSVDHVLFFLDILFEVVLVLLRILQIGHILLLLLRRLDLCLDLESLVVCHVLVELDFLIRLLLLIPNLALRHILQLHFQPLLPNHELLDHIAEKSLKLLKDELRLTFAQLFIYILTTKKPALHLYSVPLAFSR